MHRIIAVILASLALFAISCGAFQLKWDREVQEHMQTLLTNPDEVVMKIIEEWNSRPNLQKGVMVDLEFIQENILRMEFDNKKGYC
jgi:hypothetical protein